MSRVVTAYHEAGHALIARDLGRRVDSVSIGPNGGLMRGQPLASDATEEEIERALVMVFAGLEAEKYAPAGARTPERNGDDPWFTAGELAALAAEPEAETPSDEAAIAHFRERIGEEAVERAQELAAELVERLHVIGRLGQLADELLWRDFLTGDDIERLLGAPA